MTVALGPRLSGPPVRAARRPAVALACLANVVVLADATIVTVALPSIRDGLPLTPAQVPWTVNTYSLAFAVCLVAGGWLADRFGHRSPFVIGMLVFAAGSVGCALAGDSGMLFLGRVLQGAGGALFSPAALAVVTGSARPARALAVWSGAGATAVAAGPVLGGALTAGLGWRSVFGVPAVVCLAAAVAGRCRIGAAAPANRPHAIDEATSFPYLAVVTAALVLAAGSGALVTVGYAASLWLRDGLRMGPLAAGLVLLALSAGLVAGAALAPGLRRPAASGLVLAVLGAVSLTVPGGPVWLAGALAVLGAGFGLQSVPVAGAATDVPRRRGAAAATYQIAGQLGGAAGLAGITSLAGHGAYRAMFAYAAAILALTAPGLLTLGRTRSTVDAVTSSRRDGPPRSPPRPPG